MKYEDKFIKFIELRTQEEPLYLYEIYKLDPDDKENHEVPVTREFFTQEEGIRNFCSLEFLNRTCKYETQHYTFQGEWVENYVREISPFEFLEKVGPYIKNEELRKRKADEILTSMKFKAEHEGYSDYRRVKMNKTELPKEQMDEVAQKVLTKYMKIES